jgi:HK97 family phage major capsid protein
VIKKTNEEVEKVDEVEEEAKDLKALESILNKKVQEIVDATKFSQKEFLPKKDAEESLDLSTMNPDLVMRKKAPFLKLSKSMTNFVNDMKFVAKGFAPMAKTMTEGTDTAGGFLVPVEFQAEVIRYASEGSIIRSRARVWNMTRDILELPKLDQSSNVFGGVTLYWTAEDDLKVASAPTLGKIVLNAKKLIGLVAVSDELLNDSAVALANYLVSLFGEAISYEEDKEFIQGTGMGQPLGIINGVGISAVARAASAKIGYADIYGMWGKLPAEMEGNAVWITSKNGIAQLLVANQTNTNTVNFFLSNMTAPIPYTLLGKPILVTEKVDTTIGSKGDIILANLDYYYIGDRGGLEVTSSIHDRFRYDETTFRFVKRVDGQPVIGKAFVVLGK